MMINVPIVELKIKILQILLRCYSLALFTFYQVGIPVFAILINKNDILFNTRYVLNCIIFVNKRNLSTIA